MIGFGTVINSVSVLFIAIAGAIQDGLLGDYSTLASSRFWILSLWLS